MTTPIAILGAGMVTGVGLSAPTSCAAIRCGINRFNETRFIDRFGDWIVGSEVPLEPRWRGLTKLTKLAARALRECLEVVPKRATSDAQIPLVLCIAEEDRPGRLSGLGGPLLFDIEREMDMKFHPDSSIIAQGRVGGAIALLRAHKLIVERKHSHVVVCGVDTYLTGATLSAFEERNRLITSGNSNGFIPGEGAAAVLVGATGAAPGVTLRCKGLGFARETATVEGDKPLRGDGMVEAMRAALTAAGIGLEQVDHRISDVSGEQYRFKEVTLATLRLVRRRKADLGIWHPADCIGEVGAAALPIMLGVLHSAARKRYLPGPISLAYLSNDDDKRAAIVLSTEGSG